MTTTATTERQAGRSGSDDATPTVLIADKFQTTGIAGLEALGCRVDSQPSLNRETLADAVRELDPDVLIVRSTKVPESVFESAGKLSLVVRAGAGYDNIDVAAASARGVFVANCPGKNAIAVAELAWGLILACDRRIPDQTEDLRRGVWDKKGYGKGRGLYGRTLGVIGLGRIGEAVVTRAAAFGMNVIAWSRSLTPERAKTLGVEYRATPIDVARDADVVSLHVAAKPETTGLVNDEFIDAMKDGAYLINTARGAVVDGDALARGVREKGLRLGLDVYAQQPTPEDKTFADPIIGQPGVYGTHHAGASTDQAQEAIAAETVRIVKGYLDSGDVANCVNRAASSPATCLLTVRHLNRPGVLAHVFQTLSAAGINVEEMENIIYEGANAACARILLGTRPSVTQVGEVRTNENILSAELSAVAGEAD